MRTLALLLVTSLEIFAQANTCPVLEKHGKRAEAAACYRSLLRSGDALTRAEGHVGLRQYREANDEFRLADSQSNSATVKTDWGLLFLSNAQPQDAAKLFQEAMQLDPNYAPAYLGLSRALSEGFEQKPVALAKEALKHDPKYFEAHEFLAFLALEEGNETLARDEANKALAITPDALDGMAVLASIDFLKGDGVTLVDQSSWMDRIRQINPVYGEAYKTAAHFFEMNYRYSEAIAAYRKALELDASLLEARSRLGVNLMRTGQTAEAQKQLRQCFGDHFRNAETVNSLRFLDTLNRYQTFRTKSAEIVLHQDEAALLRPYIEPELERAMATYERKYKLALPGKLRLEVYPNHEDFVVRTLGLPGQGGLLGVTFGTVVALDSPAARPAGDFSWADTMWHELCHVYVITATHHLVPRWFSEGLAVHEEGVINSRWGNRLTPDAISALKEKKLLPVLELDSGFVRPQYSGQVLVSYFQAGQALDYIAQHWGDAAILGMIQSYANHKNTDEAIQENLKESGAAFDKDFTAWISKKTGNVVSHFDQWKEGMKQGAEDLRAGDASKALASINAVRDFFPEYPGSYDLLAKCYSTLGNKAEAAKALEDYRSRGGTGVDQLKQLVKLETEAAHPELAMRTLADIDLIYPEDQDTHHQLGTLFMNAARPVDAILEFRAVLALNPADVAAAHLDLARALSAAHQPSEAKDQVLLALEAAPNFKPAQQLLLQLSQ